MDTTLEKMLQARDEQVCTPLAELQAWFDRLEAVDCEFMLGSWSGGVFNTGHRGEPMLGQLGWVGKNFHSVEHVEPIVCRNAAGERVANPVMGQARLRMVGCRGNAVTASMVYDKQPIIDHFKRIDADTVLGLMDSKGDTSGLYFYLQRLT